MSVSNFSMPPADKPIWEPLIRCNTIWACNGIKKHWYPIMYLGLDWVLSTKVCHWTNYQSSRSGIRSKLCFTNFTMILSVLLPPAHLMWYEYWEPYLVTSKLLKILWKHVLFWYQIRTWNTNICLVGQYKAPTVSLSISIHDLRADVDLTVLDIFQSQFCGFKLDKTHLTYLKYHSLRLFCDIHFVHRAFQCLWLQTNIRFNLIEMDLHNM